MKRLAGKFFIVLTIWSLSVGAVLCSSATAKSEARMQDHAHKEFKVGVAATNISPWLGSSINGNFHDQVVTNIHDHTQAKSIVMNNGETTLAIVVVDLCMIYEKEVNNAKIKASKLTGIPVENMLVSATHTHSGGTACAVFQSDPDEAYLKLLSERIGDAIVLAYQNMIPAKIGWGIGEEKKHVFNRRWHMKEGVDMSNPLGGLDQVKMNPGVGSPNLLEPAGPVDPAVNIVGFVDSTGRPLAVLGNYALHYVGGVARAGDVSADYYGIYSHEVKRKLEHAGHAPSDVFLAIMSNGTSGDINNINWSAKNLPTKKPYEKMNEVASDLAAETVKVFEGLTFSDWIPLRSAVERVQVGVRKPTAEEVYRAESIVRRASGTIMQSSEEVYARETLLIKDYPAHVNLLLQAFQIGELGVAAIPAEVFVEIGLELKQKSPFNSTYVISLANGYFGYLPTPKHHELGGYETWRARSSFMEKEASVKITESVLQLLSKVKN